MTSKLLPTALTGTIFGTALTLSNVYSPSVILTQMSLTDFHMLNVFLSATAASAAIMALLEKFNIAHRQPRSASSTGSRFGAYDANILGGLLHGIGMALTGACPGTVFVQAALGISSAVPTLLGGIVGGILFARYGSALRRQDAPTDSVTNKKPQTLATKFDVDPNYILLTFEIVCFLAVSVSTFLFESTGSDAVVHPIIGGLFIGLAQATSLVLTGRALGVSTAYDEIGRYFWYAVGGGEKKERPSFRTIVFALGIMTGGFVISKAATLPASTVSIGSFRAFVGGVTVIFGARLAGGCTSGHGISGMSTFSISSIITVMAMFGGGIATAKLLPSSRV